MGGQRERKAKHNQNLRDVIYERPIRSCPLLFLQVARFVGSIPGCAEIGRIFRRQEIDGMAFLLLKKTDLEHIGIKFGPGNNSARSTAEIKL